MTGMTLKAFTDGQSLPQGLAELLLSVSEACRQISRTVRSGSAIDQPGEAGRENIQGETQKKLDVVANEILLTTCASVPSLVGMASEEMDTVHPVRPAPDGPAYLLVFDPLDGSSNIEVNVSIGTIFSVLPAPGGAGRLPTEADFLQPGSRQVAAGYVVYGPQTTMVLTTGQGVAAFRLEPLTEAWVLTEAQVKVPAETSEFAINASNMRHWAAPIGRYIADCLSGKDGPRKRNFNMRWVASMVADVHRIMVRGGVFLYPWDAREPDRPGKLRLLYEGNPMAMLVEQAGGAASNGEIRILDVAPTSLHQRVPVILGSKTEVETILAYR